LMELKQKYAKEMEELFGDDWFDTLTDGLGIGLQIANLFGGDDDDGGGGGDEEPPA